MQPTPLQMANSPRPEVIKPFSIAAAAEIGAALNESSAFKHNEQ